MGRNLGDTFMAPKAILFVLMEPQPINEEEFNDWYDLEHVPERAAVPGFELLQRYVCVDGFPRYLALYDLSDIDVLQCPEYKAIGYENSSIWTKRVTRSVRGHYRMTGPQLYPGDRITELVEGRAKRLTAVICRGMDEGGLKERASWHDAPEGRLRLYRNEAKPGDHLFLVEHGASAGGTATALVKSLEDMSPGGIVTVNHYVPYWRRNG